MRNSEIAEAFDELASLYELDGAVVYRVTAYRNAAKAIRESGSSVEELARAGRVEELAGVGKTIAEKIDALLEDGSIPAADKLRAKFPAGLVQITRLPGLGPKRVRQLHEHLGVTSVEELRAAVEAGRLADVPGFGPKAQENVLAGLAADDAGATATRFILSKALEVGDAIVEGLRPFAKRVELAGSARRMADSCKDLDVVVATADPPGLVRAFGALPEIDVVHSSGDAGARAVTHTGLPVDLRVVPEEAFGNLLQHFTGLGQAQRGASHRGRAARAARERVRDRRRRRREDRGVRHRGGGLRAAGDAVHPSGAAREPGRAGRRAQGRAARADRAGRHPRGPAHAHRGLGRQEHHRGDGGGRPRARLPVRGHHRPLGLTRLRRRRVARRAAAPDRARALAWRWTGSRSWPAAR